MDTSDSGKHSFYYTFISPVKEYINWKIALWLKKNHRKKIQIYLTISIGRLNSCYNIF